MFALSRTGMERTYTKSCEITDLLEEVTHEILSVHSVFLIKRFSSDAKEVC